MIIWISVSFHKHRHVLFLDLLLPFFCCLLFIFYDGALSGEFNGRVFGLGNEVVGGEDEVEEDGPADDDNESSIFIKAAHITELEREEGNSGEHVNVQILDQKIPGAFPDLPTTLILLAVYEQQIVFVNDVLDVKVKTSEEWNDWGDLCKEHAVDEDD